MKQFLNKPIFAILIIIVAFEFLNGKFDNPLDWIVNTLMILPAIVIGLSFHEFAHGAVSYLLGDPTPKIQGRLTLNPKAHMDPVGFLALMFAGFGWGVPVQINPQYYKHKRLYEFMVALAGVTMNLLIAIVFAFIVKLLIATTTQDFLSGNFGQVLIQVLMNVVAINLILMIFNLIPVPPLDGFGLVTQIFNLRNTKFYYMVYDKGMIILLILIFLGVTEKIINPCYSYLYQLIVNGIIL